MGIKKKIHITIENNSGENLKMSLHAADGHLVDEDEVPEVLCNNGSTTVHARRSMSYGPKIRIEMESHSDSSKRLMVYAELSINDDKPRCCYAIPDGDYVFEGMNQCYWFESSNSKDYYTKVRIGKIIKSNVFYQITDTHIGSNGISSEEYLWQRILLRKINKDSNKDGVTNMLGIIHTGDIFNKIKTEDEFSTYYSDVYKKLYKRPDKKSNMPECNEDILFSHLFEGVGNHDDENAGAHKTEVWDDVIDRSDSEWDDGDDTLDSRMPSVMHKSGADIRHKRAHYYWDWHGVRFVQVNVGVVNGLYTKKTSEDGKKEYTTYAYNSYDYLKSVLEDSKNMPVIVCTHLPVYKEDDFYNEDDRKRYIDLINSNKNIVAVINGHTHNAITGMFNAGTRSVRYIDGGKSVILMREDDKGKGKDIGIYKYIKYEFNDLEKKIYFKCVSFNSGIDGEMSGESIDFKGFINIL